MSLSIRAANALVILAMLTSYGAPGVLAENRPAGGTVVVEVRPDADPSGGGRAFTDIAAAIASISDASAAKPYLVKIMPGFYAVPAGGIAVKPFVELEGSGADATVLEGTVAPGTDLWVKPLEPGLPAVVRMAHDSRLRRLTVRNRSTAGGIAVYFPMTANAGAEDVTAEVLGVTSTGAQYDYHAIRVEGPGADVTLDRVTARYRMEVPPDRPVVGDNVAIGVFNAGKLLVRNSRAVAENGWWNIGIASENGSECVVRDSVIEVGGLAEGAAAFSAQGARDEASGTRMTVTCPAGGAWGCAAVFACSGSTVTIRDSDLEVLAGARTDGVRLLRCGGTVSSSRLAGPAVYDDWRLIDCRDGESRPIPNLP